MKRAFNDAYKSLSKETAKQYKDDFKAAQDMVKAAGKKLKSLMRDAEDESSAEQEARLA